ncbi:helix-turn-helix transcriptional regulator [Kineosporia babensis]|uniref:Helix-turn-helix transcriptional regulator n=1 Tax=Kineosporia babensis TaxID=499548 RepID=A0A9X1NGV1_9ACTN|nr:helix-turn-helix transcriptional regulator [Kineosporia babensis]MCD5312873.1 helix-turn-helix transcriptional regulator [Kineosporia babensis]
MSDLGDFLRSSRAGLTPHEVGLETGDAPRRVQGLRREEVAQLAGVSVDYYTRLEQGRHSTPSEAVLESLARTLRLDTSARLHLFDLARPHQAFRPTTQRVRPAVQQMLASLVDHPALILGRRTDVLASNSLADALLTDWRRLPARERNYTRWMLLDPLARSRFLDWATVAADAVGTLRLDAGRHPDDPMLNELVGELTIKSPEFRAAWEDHRVHERTHGTKQMTHPEVGPITLRFEALELPGDEGQTLFLYTTDPGSRSSDNLRLLALSRAGAAAAEAASEPAAEPADLPETPRTAGDPPSRRSRPAR